MNFLYKLFLNLNNLYFHQNNFIILYILAGSAQGWGEWVPAVSRASRFQCPRIKGRAGNQVENKINFKYVNIFYEF